MDAASTVIVLLFVITIINSSTGGNIGFPGAPTEKKVPIISRVNVEKIPEADFVSVAGEDVEENIQKFIISYTSKASKRPSFWDAGIMATSMVRYGGEYDVNPKLICALIARESGFNPRALSSSGAMGLGQLLPATAAALNVDNAFDPDQNIRGATRYIRFLLDKWKNHPQQVPLALASYAEGHNAISRSGAYSVKTKQYVEDILKIYWKI